MNLQAADINTISLASLQPDFPALLLGVILSQDCTK